MAIFIRASTNFTDPLPGTPILPAQPITSDSFNRSNASSLGRQTDALLGGSPLPWLGDAGTFGITNRQAAVVSSPGVFFTGVAAPVADYLASFVVREYPTGSAVYFDVRRPQWETTPTQDAIRLALHTNGAVAVTKRVSAAETILSSQFSYPLGATIGLRVKGSTASLLINGEVMVSETVTNDSLQSAGHVGFAGAAALKSFAFDDFTLTPL